MGKKIFTLFLCALLVCTFSTMALAAADTVNILINGKAVEFTESSGSPYIDDNGRTMVPLRVTMEASGAVVGWDQTTQTAIVITEHDRIEVPVGESFLYNNNIRIDNDTVAVVRNGRTYLPIRAVLESADFTIEWDNQTRTVNAYTINFDENSLVPYSTPSLETLITNILNSNVVYVNGYYYATPDYVKMLINTQIHYSGDDLNKAIYPEQSRYDLIDVQVQERQKEWVSAGEVHEQAGLIFNTHPLKGFFYDVPTPLPMYEMPSLPDQVTVGGEYDGITLKVESGTILFKQTDLIEYGVLANPITEMVAVPKE